MGGALPPWNGFGFSIRNDILFSGKALEGRGGANMNVVSRKPQNGTHPCHAIFLTKDLRPVIVCIHNQTLNWQDEQFDNHTLIQRGGGTGPMKPRQPGVCAMMQRMCQGANSAETLWTMRGSRHVCAKNCAKHCRHKPSTRLMRHTAASTPSRHFGRGFSFALSSGIQK